MLYLFLLLKSFKLDRVVHTFRTNIKKFSIVFQGPSIWNSLPNNIKNASNFTIFKRDQTIFKDQTGYNLNTLTVNTLYLYFSLTTLVYLKYTSFFFIFKCHLGFKLRVGGNLYSS